MNVAAAVRLAVPALAMLLLAACATHPGPLRGEYAPITPQDAIAHDATGTMVRWGGRVVRATPKQGQTCFEILSTRLYANGRPYWASDDARGRFIACRTGFYDPAVFEPNREVTFVGTISGYETHKIGEYDYRFPRLEASVVYLWPQRERVDVMIDAVPSPYWRPFFGWRPSGYL